MPLSRANVLSCCALLVLIYLYMTLFSAIQDGMEDKVDTDYIYEDYYTEGNGTNYEKPDDVPDIVAPSFISSSKTVVENEGGTVKLPCLLDIPGKFRKSLCQIKRILPQMQDMLLYGDMKIHQL